MQEVTVPHKFTPRNYQRPFFKAMEVDGYRRAVLVWPRRHGKDKTCFAFVLRQMMRRVGNYAYIFPTASLARKAAWQNIDADGFKLLDHIPKELVAKKQDQSMHVELVNGSTITFFGSDRQVSVGTNYIGIVLSEFAIQDPSAWNLLRPVIRQNKGWVVMNSTPRGRNHYHDMYNIAKDNDEWYTDLLTADDTDVFTPEDIQAERDSGMSEEVIQQEFYCSFTRGIEGSYYGRLIDEMRMDGRICRIYPEVVKTYAVFDLGMNDSTSIIVWQHVNQEIHIIDHYENNGEAIEHYVRWLRSLDYLLDDVYLPHDAKVRELSTGQSRIEAFSKAGVSVSLVPNVGLLDGIETVRQILPRCWIEEKNCRHLVDSLEMYHKEYNEKFGIYSDRPTHDKWSHNADAMRYLAIIVAHGLNSGCSRISEFNKTLVPRI